MSAYQIIDTLVQLGVTHFCFAPGSRSTPLVLALAEHPKASRLSHFDERGLGFYALGVAKAKRAPVALIVTSGTAVANLLPAVMEASLDRIPLILLTADRPPELRACGANQTCDQVKLFGAYVRFEIDLDPAVPERYLSALLSQAVSMASYPPKGPVHINCMFREPFDRGKQVEILAVEVIPPEMRSQPSILSEWKERLAIQERGVILVGSSPHLPVQEIFSLAETLQWPIFADILSPIRSEPDHPTRITHFDPILKSDPSLTASALIQFGNRFVSKTLGEWIQKQSLDFYLHVTDHPDLQDPLHRITHRIYAHTSSLIPDSKPMDTWLSFWKEKDLAIQEGLERFFEERSDLSEPSLVRSIARQITSEWALFLGNSMPIRDANQFFNPQKGCGPIFGNRGASGIDGNIATAVGIANGCKRPTFALIGDQTFLHDLNSLALLKKAEFPVVLCVVNNGGGGIFSFLPIAKQTEHFEELFAASHNLSFKSAAELFGLPYYHPESIEDFHLPFHSCLIEVTTDRAQNVLLHQACLHSFSCTVS
ncbi:MAG: 2-succinyl-5-enolpyruvyl-6-hydroxy-3-cyclohexene-1-carboxylic-acid synthase [Verrucomicrobia bacterium]|nr:2-succinyl-5-enolpyruvyl-6-hydroxy-3-cyclohexene-1-carboxylic-acid synthase [Verrucomicrobiota bacterium]